MTRKSTWHGSADYHRAMTDPRNSSPLTQDISCRQSKEVSTEFFHSIGPPSWHRDNDPLTDHGLGFDFIATCFRNSSKMTKEEIVQVCSHESVSERFALARTKTWADFSNFPDISGFPLVHFYADRKFRKEIFPCWTRSYACIVDCVHRCRGLCNKGKCGRRGSRYLVRHFPEDGFCD